MNRLRLKPVPVLLLMGLALADRRSAGTAETVSEVFGFDTRDSACITEALSGVFSMDARRRGNAASSVSGVFALGTQSGNLDALVIDAGAPGSVVAGQAVAFPALESFAGQGGALVDVSGAATSEG